MSPVDLKEALKTLKMSRPYAWHVHAPPGTPVPPKALKWGIQRLKALSKPVSNGSLMAKELKHG